MKLLVCNIPEYLGFKKHTVRRKMTTFTKDKGFNNVIRNNLQALRWKKGWTQRELAEHSGVSYSLICRIENGDRPNPSITTALLLAQALGVPVDEIFML